MRKSPHYERSLGEASRRSRREDKKNLSLPGIETRSSSPQPGITPNDFWKCPVIFIFLFPNDMYTKKKHNKKQITEHATQLIKPEASGRLILKKL
jgi:hypothetical protein